MKRTIAVITLVLMLLTMLGACKKADTTPSVSPNVPVVSESPAIPSPDIDESPAASPAGSPGGSPAASPGGSPEASPKAS